MARNSTAIDWDPYRTRIIEMLKARATASMIAERLGVSSYALRRLILRENLGQHRGEKPAAQDRPKPKPKGRNPMKDIGKWKPGLAITDLDRAVQILRSRHAMVCDEDTIRYPSRVPEAYKPTTLFRVGAKHNVTAAQLLRMAA